MRWLYISYCESKGPSLDQCNEHLFHTLKGLLKTHPSVKSPLEAYFFPKKKGQSVERATRNTPSRQLAQIPPNTCPFGPSCLPAIHTTDRCAHAFVYTEKPTTKFFPDHQTLRSKRPFSPRTIRLSCERSFQHHKQALEKLIVQKHPSSKHRHFQTRPISQQRRGLIRVKTTSTPPNVPSNPSRGSKRAFYPQIPRSRPTERDFWIF